MEMRAMTADEQHRVECDLERAALRKEVDAHAKQLASHDRDLVAIKTKLASWSALGAILGSLLGKLIP